MKFAEEKQSSPSINLIPILDCIFVLVFVFMVMLLNVAKREGLNLSLPIAQSTQAIIHPQTITIQLTAQKTILLHDQKVSVRELDRELEFISLEAHQPALVIKGDRDTPLSQTIHVLDIVKKHGFSNVTIETSKNQ